MRVDILLTRLSKVQPRGNAQWMCRCPAHQDRTASLSVAEIDGRVLLHCFAGCEPDAVLGAVGLQFSDLYPDRTTDHAAPRRHVVSASDALRIAKKEIAVIAIVASDILESREMTPDAWQRFADAASRINEIVAFTRE